MEIGANVSLKNAKGPRGFNRLNHLRDKLVFFAKHFEIRFKLNKITDISEEQVIRFFSDMKNGVLKKVDGATYTSTNTFANVFKSFWHWWQRANKKKGIDIPDITIDLDTRQDKPDWVYLTEEQVKKLAESSKYTYKVLILFLYDTGIRAPTELVNIRVSDLMNDCKELNIRQEISKTFGRRIKLLLCSDIIKEYIRTNELKGEDQLFDICPSVVNRQLKRTAIKLLGDVKSPAGQRYSELTMYDFRHCSCCYWLPRYKSESALKYRFGWKKSDKIHYYSELLGMSDTITEEDLLIDTTKTELEQRLSKAEKEKEIMQERMKTMEMQMVKIMELTKQLGMEIK
jgi:integrase